MKPPRDYKQRRCCCSEVHRVIVQLFSVDVYQNVLAGSLISVTLMSELFKCCNLVKLGRAARLAVSSDHDGAGAEASIGSLTCSKTAS